MIALLTECPFDSPVCFIKADRHFGPSQQRMFCSICFEYAQGRAKPNYPMPAIRLAVMLNRLAVGVYDATNKQWVVSTD